MAALGQKRRKVSQRKRGSHISLLTGEVGYQWIATNLKRDLSRLGVSHHGGHGCENPTSAIPGGRAVVSYGVPNRYGHPINANIQAHIVAKWQMAHTAETPSGHRGDRWLT